MMKLDLGNGVTAVFDLPGSEGDRIKIAVLTARGLPIVRDANGYLDLSGLKQDEPFPRYRV